MKNNNNKNHDIKLSKTLSYILRHKAIELGFNMTEDGYILCSEILNYKKLKKYSLNDIKLCVENNNKKRFQLKSKYDHIDISTIIDPNDIYIRASQGHTINSINNNLLLEKITSINEIKQAIHGTYYNAWELIQSTGLNRMQRNHIHFAIGDYNNSEVISGMRNNVNILIYLDISKILNDGIELYRSANNVILSSGINGVIPPSYFLKVVDVKTNKIIFTNNNNNNNNNNNEINEESKINNIINENSNNNNYSTNTTTTNNNNNNYNNNNIKFDYYGIIDFEATCDDNIRLNPQEIIEFPTILIDANTFEKIDEFHSYIKPIHNPILTNFCTELTGIEQSKIENALTFDIVFEEYCKWLNSYDIYLDNTGKKIAFVTCGDWDLRTMLKQQSLTSNINIPIILKQWINIKIIFTEYMKNNNIPIPVKNNKKKKKWRVRSMTQMLEILNMNLIGRHHSGIDDSRNITNILIYLLNNNVKPYITGNINY